MNKFLLTFALLVGISFQLMAATVTWNGGTGEWTTDANWDTGTAPTIGDIAIISGSGSIVTLSGTTTVQTVTIAAGATLTVASGVTLTIDGSTADHALETTGLTGTITNNGTINITNVTAQNGIHSKGTFSNNGTISVSGIDGIGVNVPQGTFTNESGGTLTVTDILGSADDYIRTDNDGSDLGTFNNEGTIEIVMTTGDEGIYVNDGSTFNNSSIINISTTAATLTNKESIYVQNNGILNNLAGGNITISTARNIGIRATDGGAISNAIGGEINIGAIPNDQIQLQEITSFTNAGTINLTNGLDLGLNVFNQATFTNTVDGIVNVTGAANFSIQVDANNEAAAPFATLDNFGTITVTGGSNDGLRVRRKAVLNNQAGGILNLNNTGDEGIEIDAPSTFNNSGTIDIAGTVDHGMELLGTFNNMNGGLFKAAGVVDDGIRVQSTGLFNNDGAISIDGSGNDDIQAAGLANFVNTSNATFAPGSSPGDLDIRNDFDLGSATVTFEITGTSAVTEYDQIANTDNIHSITVSGATAVLDWGAFVPAVNDQFKLVDGSGTVNAAGALGFAAINSSNPSIIYTIDYITNTDELRLIVTAVVLPVELNSFEGKIQNKSNILTWQTQTEQNNDYFEVQYSTNGREFSTIDMVQGNGTTSEVQNYEYTHKDVKSNNNYYRLKQVDFDGEFEYSDIIYLQNDTRDTPVAIFPNPARDLVTYEGAAATLTFFDIQGRQVMQQTANERTAIDISTLRSGVYTIEILTNTGERRFEKLIKE